MTRSITIEYLVTTPSEGKFPLADVRSPAEYSQGHVPGACNLPLFSNEERTRVGTTYKTAGREAAILLGFELTGNKWPGFIRQALEFAPDKKIGIHCWRGGMRSAAMAWALDLYGFEVVLIRGGYKAFRHWALQQFEKPYVLSVIGGMTGSGKTRILTRMQEIGEQTIDLEDLAQHRGSSYGSLNRLIQPTQEQFENELATRLFALDANRRTWIEDESQNIGKRTLPKPFWKLLRSALLFDIRVPLEHRVGALVEEYGRLDRDFLVECTERINRRLGPEQTKLAINAILEGRMDDFVRQVLIYYDKTYRKGLSDRDPETITPIETPDGDARCNTDRVLAAAINFIPSWTFS
jgi:tRNA 2-selenouridine synthase